MDDRVHKASDCIYSKTRVQDKIKFWAVMKSVNIYLIYVNPVLKYRPMRAFVFTFRVRRRRREMYIGYARLCVCLSVAACLHHCTDPDLTWGNGRG